MHRFSPENMILIGSESRAGSRKRRTRQMNLRPFATAKYLQRGLIRNLRETISSGVKGFSVLISNDASIGMRKMVNLAQ
jgi:hypothetical protein